MLFGERGVVTRKRKAQCLKLEVKVRTSGNADIIDDLIELARGYSKVGRHNEAERTMRQALTLTEQEFGKGDSALLPVLDAYASVLTRAKRQVEANSMKQRARAIKENKPFEEKSFKRSRR